MGTAAQQSLGVVPSSCGWKKKIFIFFSNAQKNVSPTTLPRHTTVYPQVDAGAQCKARRKKRARGSLGPPASGAHNCPALPNLTKEKKEIPKTMCLLGAYARAEGGNAITKDCVGIRRTGFTVDNAVDPEKRNAPQGRSSEFRPYI